MNIDNYTTIHDLYFTELEGEIITNNLDIAELNCKQLFNYKTHIYQIKNDKKFTAHQKNVWSKFIKQLNAEYDAKFENCMNEAKIELHKQIRDKEKQLFKQKCHQINETRLNILEEIEFVLEQKKQEALEERKQNLNKKFTCKCGAETNQKNWTRHCQSQKHQIYEKIYGLVQKPSYKKPAIEK